MLKTVKNLLFLSKKLAKLANWGIVYRCTVGKNILRQIIPLSIHVPTLQQNEGTCASAHRTGQ